MENKKIKDHVNGLLQENRLIDAQVENLRLRCEYIEYRKKLTELEAEIAYNEKMNKDSEVVTEEEKK